jgi:hypothetical protein
LIEKEKEGEGGELGEGQVTLFFPRTLFTASSSPYFAQPDARLQRD